MRQITFKKKKKIFYQSEILIYIFYTLNKKNYRKTKNVLKFNFFFWQKIRLKFKYEINIFVFNTHALKMV